MPFLPERESPPGTSSGVAIVLTLDPADRKALALKDGLPAEELHCTLAYLGKAKDLPADGAERVRRAVKAWAAGRSALAASVGGVGRFPGDPEDGDPVYVPVDCPRLPRERQELLTALAAAGVPAREDHGFNAHITLSYVDPKDDLPVQRVAPRNLAFRAVEVWYGGKHSRYALSRTTQENRSMRPSTLRALIEIAETPTRFLASHPLREAEGHDGEKMVFGVWRNVKGQLASTPEEHKQAHAYHSRQAQAHKTKADAIADASRGQDPDDDSEALDRLAVQDRAAHAHYAHARAHAHQANNHHIQAHTPNPSHKLPHTADASHAEIMAKYGAATRNEPMIRRRDGDDSDDY